MSEIFNPAPKPAKKEKKSHFWQVYAWKKGVLKRQAQSLWETFEFREAVRVRDNYICQLCGKKFYHLSREKARKLVEVHHVRGRTGQFATDVRFALTLCKRPCHDMATLDPKQYRPILLDRLRIIYKDKL